MLSNKKENWKIKEIQFIWSFNSTTIMPIIHMSGLQRLRQ